jgi:protein-tyrosine-phosphatase
MSTALAERERERRDVDVEIVTGGTDPADKVHPEVVEVMRELDVDLSDRSPRKIAAEDLEACDYVITMGCSAGDVCPAGYGGEVRDWDLQDPHGQDPDTVREIRNDIRERIQRLFDELEEKQ